MFSHIFITRLKCLLRDRQLVFWTLLFPILLGVFFNMAFSNLNKEETFQAFPIAVVQSDAYQKDTAFRTVLESVSKGSGRIFDLTVAENRQAADKLLAENKIKGYITVGDEIGMTVKNSGLYENILKAFLDSYRHTASSVSTIIKTDPAAVGRGLLNDLGAQKDFTREVPISSAKPDNILNYFYALLAMTCMYGGFWGLKEITDIQANLSPRAARVNVAPVHKLKAFLSGFCAALLIQSAEILVLLAFLMFGLHIDFGTKTVYVVLTALAGGLAGLSLGAFISALIRGGEGIKVAVLLAVSMTGSFLSGMMYGDIKYIIQQHVPILSYLNPVNLLTDAFYSLYYYDTFGRYALNMGLLGVSTFIFCAGTYFIIRRQKYASL
ncbi:MAG: ABC transporter permease [Clostridiales bacterium]|nr:ABC transporter permease [Clostridiales bacterium]